MKVVRLNTVRVVRIGLYKISPKYRKNCLANDAAPGIKDKNRSISITTAHGGYFIMLGVFVRIFLISFCLMGVFLFFCRQGVCIFGLYPVCTLLGWGTRVAVIRRVLATASLNSLVFIVFSLQLIIFLKKPGAGCND